MVGIVSDEQRLNMDRLVGGIVQCEQGHLRERERERGIKHILCTQVLTEVFPIIVRGNFTAATVDNLGHISSPSTGTLTESISVLSTKLSWNDSNPFWTNDCHVFQHAAIFSTTSAR